MKLILTRHGQTFENNLEIIQGHFQGQLDDSGLEQCKKLGERLKNEHIDVIYSSDLERTADTAKEIHKHHPNIPIIFTEDLRERNLGEYEGKKYNEVEFDNDAQHIERHEAMRLRAKKVIDLAYSKYHKKTVVFVGHAGINAIIYGLIKNKELNNTEYLEALKKQGNTCISIFEISEDKNKIILQGCTQHLTK